METLEAELNKKAEAVTSSYYRKGNFYNLFILYLLLRIIRSSNHGFELMNFPLQTFFNIKHGYIEKNCGSFRSV